MPSNHLILCCPLLLPPPVFPSIRVFSNESVLRIRWECELGLAVVQSVKRMIRRTGWFSKDYGGPPLCWLVFWHQCHINHLQLSRWSTRLSRVPKECPYCGTWLMKPWTWSWNARRPSSGRWTRMRKRTLWVQALRWALGINACHFVIVSQVRRVRVVASAWSWGGSLPHRVLSWTRACWMDVCSFPNASWDTSTFYSFTSKSFLQFNFLFRKENIQVWDWVFLCSFGHLVSILAM